MELIIYSTPHAMPIYNYIKCENGDFRYMAKIDVNSIEDVKIEGLEAKFKALKEQITNPDFKTDVKFNIAVDTSDINNIFTSARNWAELLAYYPMCDDDNKAKLLKYGGYYTLNTDQEHNAKVLEGIQKKVIQANKQLEQVMSEGSSVMSETDLVKAAVNMGITLGIDIDIMTCSITKFQGFSSAFQQKIKALSDGR